MHDFDIVKCCIALSLKSWKEKTALFGFLISILFPILEV